MKLKKLLASILSLAVLVPSICGCEIFAVSSKHKHRAPKGENYDTEKKIGGTSKLTDFTFNGKKIQSGSDLSRLKLDLFEGDNLNIALMHGLEFIISDDISPYVDDKSSITKAISENEPIAGSVRDTINYIKNKKENDNDKNLEIFKRLHTIESMMKNDQNIQSDNAALKFISGMKSAYQMVISRAVAEQILEDSREKIESAIGSEVHSASGELSSSIPQEGFNIGLSAGLSTNQQSTETSFYKIDNSGSLGVSIGTGLKNYLSANAACAFGITNSLIFYSLEEFLDTGMDKGNISFLKLKDEDVKNVITSRKQMQRDENAIIVKLKTSIEPFLKFSGIVPQNLTFKMPDLTYFGVSEKNYGLSVNSKLDAQASCLAKAGMNVSTEASLNKIKSYHPYLDLIDENFIITDYCTDIDDLVTYLKTANTYKYKEVKESVSSMREKPNTTETLSLMISHLTNDIKRYNHALAIMADKDLSTEDKAEAQSIKKNTEKNWIGDNISAKNKHSRETMLKVAISVGAYLRNSAKSDEEKDLFLPLYNEVQNLSLLQKFTNKILFKAQQGFDTSRTSNKLAVNGETYIDIPLVGKTNLSVSYSETESKLYTENSKDITITTQLPLIKGKLYGSETLKEKLKDFVIKISQANNKASLILADSLELVDKDFDMVASDYGVEKTSSTPKGPAPKHYMNLHFYLTEIPKTENLNELIALPDNRLIKKGKNEVILKLTKKIETLNKDLSLNHEVGGIAASSKVGKASSKIGKDSLIFTVNKFNTCKLGKNLMSVSGIWNKFKESQKSSLAGLFNNITDDKSNAKYELQCIYSAIVKNIKAKSEISNDRKSLMLIETENIFRDFLNSCKELKKSKSDIAAESSYKTASELLDTILNLNYDWVWYPALLSAYSK